MSESAHDVNADEEEDEVQFVAVEDESGEDEEKEDVDADGNKADDDDDDSGDDDSEKKADARLGGGRDDEEDEVEAKRARRREERKVAKQRKKDFEARRDREVDFLRDRNEQLERRFTALEHEVDQRVTGTELAGIDSNISKAKADLVLAGQVIEQAIEQSNGKDASEAMTHRDIIRDNLRDLEQAKEYLTQDENRRGGEQPMALDPRHVAHANSFMVQHDWWDPRGGDNDSKAVSAIDNALAKEGFNPITKAYWDELDTRVRKELPHHFDAGDDATDDDTDAENTAGEGDTGNGKTGKRRSRGPTFRTGGRERPLKKNEVHISKERREAMEEHGVWDDPKTRNRYLAAYAKYDDEEAQERGRK